MTTPLFSDVFVNGECIPKALIGAEAQNHQAPRDKPGIAWRKAADALALRTLLLQEARKQGLKPDPQNFGDMRTETEEDALVRKLLDNNTIVARPTEAEVYAEWKRAPQKFRAPSIWEASHILFSLKTGSDPEKVQAKACRTAAHLQIHPEDFGEIASRESDCTSGKTRGKLGQITPGRADPEFEAALRNLSEGEIAKEPVRTKFGFHIVRLEAYLEGSVLPYETVRARISDAMEKSAWAYATARYVDKLLETAIISGADIGARAPDRREFT